MNSSPALVTIQVHNIEILQTYNYLGAQLDDMLG